MRRHSPKRLLSGGTMHLNSGARFVGRREDGSSRYSATRWEEDPTESYSRASSLRAADRCPGAGDCEKIIHRPVVVHIRAVLCGEDHAIGADQEVCRQTHVLFAPAHGAAQVRRSRQGAVDCPPRARIKCRQRRHLPDAEFGVELLVGVRDCGKRQLALKLQHGFAFRVEHDHLPDPGGENIVMPPRDGAQMYIASRAAGISAELQMHQPFGIGHPRRMAMNVHQFATANHVSDVQLGHDVPLVYMRCGACERCRGQTYRAAPMHTAVTASSTAAMRWAVAMRDRAPASSVFPTRRLLIARPPMAPWTPAATSAASAPIARTRSVVPNVPAWTRCPR